VLKITPLGKKRSINICTIMNKVNIKIITIIVDKKNNTILKIKNQFFVISNRHHQQLLHLL
jgi:hypothetical protein